MVFLISPARTNGLRADQLAVSRSPMGGALRAGRAPLGEVFIWLSALYFRGKLTYAQAFAPRATYIMAPGLGLVPAAHRIGVADLRGMAAIEIESDAFATPLRRAAARLRHRGEVVLLGSIATGKYIDTLLDVFGERLVFPAAFVGRGDMSRGGLLLRAARAGEQLAYAPVRGAVRHGKRPPKLPRLAAGSAGRQPHPRPHVRAVRGCRDGLRDADRQVEARRREGRVRDDQDRAVAPASPRRRERRLASEIIAASSCRRSMRRELHRRRGGLMENATRVLVVDDQEDVAVMLGDAIEMIGLRSYIAFDATTALDLAETFAPDVALLDLGLPDLDGCELGRRLRARHGKQLFLVAVTAWSDEVHRTAAAAAGFHAYLVKPVKIADIQRVVSELLEGAKRPAAQPASEPPSVPQSRIVP